MVSEGQYLERATVVPGPAGPLEGLYHRGARRPGVVIAPPGPGEGGSMESPVVAELAWALTRAGHATLRFNYRGVGASAGAPDPGAAAEDLEAAVAHLRATLGDPAAPVALCGLGFGADLALARAASSPAGHPAVVAVSPRGTSWPALEWVGGPCVVIRAQHASDDPAALRAALEARPGGRLVTIPRADPGFVRGLVHVGRVAVDALAAVADPDPELEGDHPGA